MEKITIQIQYVVEEGGTSFHDTLNFPVESLDAIPSKLEEVQAKKEAMKKERFDRWKKHVEEQSKLETIEEEIIEE